MKFYDCLTAPSPRRVRMFIAEKEIDIETVFVDLGSGEHLKLPFIELNPKASVPVLLLDNGTMLNESMAISVYLDSVFPDNNLTGLDPIERAVIAIAQLDMDLNGLQAVAECFRNSARGFAGRAMVGPIGYDQIPELVERGRSRVKLFFNSLNERLAKSDYIAGDRFTVADITAFISLEFAKFIKEKPSEDAIHLQRWYSAIAQRKCAKV